MPDPATTPSGSAAFLDRIGADIDGLENPPADPTPNPAPAPGPKGTPSPEPGSKIDDLDLGTPPLDPKDSLDDLDPGDPNPAPEPDPKPTDGDDPLADFDEAERAKIQAYLDERLAKELTETESAGGAFKRLRAENRELQTQLQTLQSKGADSEALAAATARIKELEEAARVREQADSVLRLEDTQAYKDAVIAPQQEILSASDAIADRYGADPDKLADLLSTADRRELSSGIVKLLGDDVSEADKFELYDLNRRTQATFAKKRELAANADAAIKEAEELASQERQRAALQARQGREAAAEAAVKRLNEKAKFILDIAGADAIKAATKDIAERDVADLSEADRAFARLSAKALVPLAKKVLALEKELADANDELVARRKAAPGSRSGGSPVGDPPPADPEPGNFAARAADRIAGAIGGA